MQRTYSIDLQASGLKLEGPCSPSPWHLRDLISVHSDAECIPEFVPKALSATGRYVLAHLLLPTTSRKRRAVRTRHCRQHSQARARGMNTEALASTSGRSSYCRMYSQWTYAAQQR